MALDLMIIGSAVLDWRKIEALKDALAESNLPITVDVIDGNAISESFRGVVDKQYEVIQTSRGNK